MQVKISFTDNNSSKIILSIPFNQKMLPWNGASGFTVLLFCDLQEVAMSRLMRVIKTMSLQNSNILWLYLLLGSSIYHCPQDLTLVLWGLSAFKCEILSFFLDAFNYPGLIDHDAPETCVWFAASKIEKSNTWLRTWSKQANDCTHFLVHVPATWIYYLLLWVVL